MTSLLMVFFFAKSVNFCLSNISNFIIKKKKAKLKIKLEVDKV